MTAIARGVALALVALPAWGGAIEVWIEQPRSTQFVFGEVVFEASVQSEESIVAVEFFLDGRKLGEFTAPPYRLTVDVGYDNVEHEFRVSARDVSGKVATGVMVTGALRVDELVEIDLQQLYVTVSDARGRVLDLERDDFRIVDEGEEQEIVTFERGEIPLTAALLLDCSLSMEKHERLGAALAGARVFVSGMNPLDRAMVMLFSDRQLRATEFTGETEVLARTLTDVEAVGGTAINDHLFVALARLEMEQGRRVVVLFSDGEDVHSVLRMEDVLQKARSSQALIYWVLLRESGAGNEVRKYSTSWRDVEANLGEAKLLREAIRESGGRIEIVEDIASLDDAFAGILAELREQYVLGYYPSEDRADGSWHDVKVRVRRSGVEVRTREGYLDY